MMAQQLEKPQNRPTAGTLFTVSNVARTWKLPKSKCQKKATPGSQPVDKIISPFAFCAKVLGTCTSQRDTGCPVTKSSLLRRARGPIKSSGSSREILLLTCCEKQSLSTWPARASYPRRRGWDTDVLLETRGTTYVQVNRRFTGHAPGGSEAGRGFEGYSPRSPVHPVAVQAGTREVGE